MKAIIVDDERLARKELKNLLAEFPHIEIIKECDSADSAIEEVSKLKPDVVFLDIHMPGKDGFGVLEELDYTPHIIFVTAYDEYALKAFKLNSIDYLLKPLDDDELEVAVNKFKANYPKQSDVQVNLDEIRKLLITKIHINLCIRNNIQRNVMYMTGLNHDEEEGLVFNDNLVVVGRNIEKPPEYIE